MHHSFKIHAKINYLVPCDHFAEPNMSALSLLMSALNMN